MLSRRKTTQRTRRPMSVTFVRSGERRYAVRVAVEGMPEMMMDPAPGYDAVMPHDLQHFIVERALGMDGAIYGQLAAGGTADTFHAVARSSGRRAASRARRKRDRRSSRLMSSHAEDCARSERATYICWHDWLAHSKEPVHRARALTINQAVESMLQAMPGEERALYTAEKLRDIRSQFSALSARWSALAVGEGFTERW